MTATRTAGTAPAQAQNVGASPRLVTWSRARRTTAAATVATAPVVLLAGIGYHPFIADLRDKEAVAAALTADVTRWSIAHLVVAVAAPLVILAFLAVAAALRQRGEWRWSTRSVPFVVVAGHPLRAAARHGDHRAGSDTVRRGPGRSAARARRMVHAVAARRGSSLRRGRRVRRSLGGLGRRARARSDGAGGDRLAGGRRVPVPPVHCCPARRSGCPRGGSGRSSAWWRHGRGRAPPADRAGARGPWTDPRSACCMASGSGRCRIRTSS